jgi:hypothetical protein
MGEETTSVTLLLKAWSGGDQEALGELTSRVYLELRQMAAKYMRKERTGDSLQTTGLATRSFFGWWKWTMSAGRTARISSQYRQT